MRHRVIKPPKDGDRESFFAKIPWSFDDGCGQLMRIEDGNDNLMAILMYNAHMPHIIKGRPTYHGGNIFLSVAGFRKDWFASKDIYYCLFAYPFNQLMCNRVTIITPIFHMPVIKLCNHIGFEKEGRIKDFYSFDDQVYDAIVMGITYDMAKDKGYIS